MNKKDIIEEGLNDSQTFTPEKNKDIALKTGDTLIVKAISNGEIILSIPSKKHQDESKSEGSYMVRE